MQIQKLFLNLKMKIYFVINVDVDYIKMEKLKLVFKSTYVVDVIKRYQKHQIP